ncbi:IS256-like element ISWch2 family transposase [Waddlia chondrophila]|uniref:Mutator family transposase n=2 Tax=Waddlia chondrophila TaxID=71667 RepID=D6YUP3_WADCW|nr:IS256-like element ISWch2 family transposase [Waddlia chondrophila]ADI37853.1 transposase [Waddlia chondrophila WSU 86-1044]
MKDDVIFLDKFHATSEMKSFLEQTLREGARFLLQQAVENEVNEYLESMSSRTNSEGRKQFVRNGYLPEREVQTGIGPIAVKQPRVRDKNGFTKYSSAILPKYLRRTPSLEAVIPALYLRGISTNNFQEALEAIMGKDAKGLSAANITRLKQSWEQEYKDWNKRSLEGKHYAYIWVDGIYFNVRLEDDRICFLVILGALPNGKKELIAIHNGYRESKISWTEVLENLKRRGLCTPPELAIGDGALGFWSAIEEVFPKTKQQRCWVHKTANVLDKMPKSVQVNAKKAIHEIYLAPTKEDGLAAFETFLKTYRDKYPKACACLEKDKAQLFTFYNFPAIHWQHIRTTNPIESTFATIRHRTRQTKGCGSVTATLTMVFKLATSAEKKWRKLKGCEMIEKVIRGVIFKNGEEVMDKEKIA